jgi:NAD(P)-dependent dehydrogenase (short-subunit alcohol dehydrogenase family)
MSGTDGTTALVVGANRGIGLELARQLGARGFRVVAACRKSSPELEATGAEVHGGIDVTDPASLRALSDRLPTGSVDWLLVVAGILRRDGLDGFDPDSVRDQFEVNALGPLQTAVALRDRLAPGAKIGLLTSRMGSIEDNTSGGMYGYRMSKAALNMAGKSLALDLKNEGISVAILHPGFVRTEMTGGSGHIDAEESASGLIERMDALTLENSGSFWHQSGEFLPW